MSVPINEGQVGHSWTGRGLWTWRRPDRFYFVRLHHIQAISSKNIRVQKQVVQKQKLSRVFFLVYTIVSFSSFTYDS